MLLLLAAGIRGLESERAALGDRSVLNGFVPERALRAGGSASRPEFELRMLFGKSLGIALRLDVSSEAYLAKVAR